MAEPVAGEIGLEGLPPGLVFCFMMHSCRARLGLVVVALVLAGCATAPSDALAPDPWSRLTANLTADQVRALLGPPAEVRPMKSSQGPAEIWIYRRTAAKDVSLVATHTQDLSVMNPRTGSMETMPAPVYDQETRTVKQELQLLMFEGKLVTWKSGNRSERSYF